MAVAWTDDGRKPWRFGHDLAWVRRIATATVLLGISCSGNKCGSTVIHDVPLSHDSVRAVTFLRSCGGAVGRLFGNVDVIYANDDLPEAAGRVFVFWGPSDSVSVPLAGAVDIAWLGKDTLKVTYDRWIEVIHKAVFVRGKYAIVYDER